MRSSYAAPDRLPPKAIRNAWSKPRVRLASGAAAFAMVTTVTYVIARAQMFTGFPFYDDEGYMLIALKSFLNQGSLYDEVFTQYGPFYYEAWGAIFSILGVPVDHNAGRAATAVAWVLASLLVGGSIWRITGSVLIGLATQILAFGVLISLIGEPMHPGGMICVLLGTLVAASSFVRRRESPYAIALLGATTMALILVKVNVGVFAFAAIALVCTVSYPAIHSRRYLRPAVELTFVALPLLVTLSRFSEAWARHYAVHVAVAALAVVIALRAHSATPRYTGELQWLLGGLVIVGLTVCAAILGAGTTPGGLVDGVLLQPLRQADAFWSPLALDNQSYLFDLLALVGAIAYWYAVGDRGGAAPSAGWRAFLSVASVLVGLTLALSVIGRTILFTSISFPGYPLGFLALAWVALVRPAGAGNANTAFARLLLPPLAVLQGLHAFPVAGSQVQWSAFLLIPVGALCVANGVQGLSRLQLRSRERRALAAIALAASAVLLTVLVNVQLREPLKNTRAVHDGGVSLGLPGAEDIRVSPEEAALYRSITNAIVHNCRSFVMLPGMNSFYLWTEQEPPTGLNATAWTLLFEDADEEKIVAATQTIEDMCVLENAELAAQWSGGRVSVSPLVRYIHSDFEPIAAFGRYRLLKRETETRSS